jgi:nucleoside-diphosphate-sugar epimerase
MNILILGHGAVGRETAARFAARGDKVTVAQRHRPAALAPMIDFTGLDVCDRDAVIAASAGVDVVICCLGFPYDSRLWAKAWPSAMGNLLAGCAASGARFIFADNLYMYGPQDLPLVEDMPLTTYGRKPRIRAEITRLWQEAHATGRVTCVAVRASDFYGPGVENSVLSEFGVKRLIEGKPALVPYCPDHLHDFAYVPDFARALVTLADAPETDYGQAWHVPNAPAQSLRALLERAAEMIGTIVRIVSLPLAALHLAGLFDRRLYELIEMRFQTDRPYLVDAKKFERRFWNDPTPFDTGLEVTIAHYRALWQARMRAA